ncbi:hypothetical protein L0337_00715 [candidate division KSB1 bacterium]|nr:hypothetical protein [candidate division KSB1 bacterium]
MLIDLKKHRRLWEDFYDLMIVESRRDEPRVDWQAAKRRLSKYEIKDKAKIVDIAHVRHRREAYD